MPSRRPEATFLSTWAVALTIPVVCCLLPFLPLAVLLVLGAAASATFAHVDADRCQRVLGGRLAHPMISVMSPIAYLLVRHLRNPDLRSGRPLWTALALVPVILFFEVVAAIGAYGMQVHGF